MKTDLSHIPSLVWDLYAGCPWPVRLLTYGRCLICSFGMLLTYVPQFGNIIELGCGTGIFSNLISLRNADQRVTGYDIRPGAVKAAKQAASGRKNINFFVKSAESAEIGEDVQTVVSIDLFHHLEKGVQARLIEKIHGNLKPGGLFILKDLDTEPAWKPERKGHTVYAGSEPH